MADSICKQCQTPLQPTDLRCWLCGCVPDLPNTDFVQPVIKFMKCIQCGASVEYDARTQSTKCAFCAESLELVESQDPIERTDYLLPFTVPDEQLNAGFKNWLQKLGFFVPSSIKSSAQLENVRKVWWVGWSANMTSTVSWTINSSSYSPRRAKTGPAWGMEKFVYENLVLSASRGLNQKETSFLTPSYKMESAVTIDAIGDNANGILLERHTATRSKARETLVHAFNHLAQQEVLARYSTFHAHTPKTSMVIEGLKTFRVGFPAYILAYRYKGKSWRVVASGQNLEYIDGHYPISILKVAVTILIGLVLAMAAFGIISR